MPLASHSFSLYIWVLAFALVLEVTHPAQTATGHLGLVASSIAPLRGRFCWKRTKTAKNHGLIIRQYYFYRTFD